MKMKLIIIATAVALLTGTVVKADDHDDQNTNKPLFHDNEASLDLFGTYLNPERHLSDIFQTNIRHGSWGGGVGLNYFPIRYIGVGADTSFQDGAVHFVNHAGGNLFLRLPIEVAHIAPYIFGGGGRQFDPIGAYFGDGGVGLDIRFNCHASVFSDARYNFLNKTNPNGTHDSALFRVGLKFVL